MLSMPHADLASFPGSTAQLFFACSKTAYFTMCEKKLGESLGTRLMQTRNKCLYYFAAKKYVAVLGYLYCRWTEYVYVGWG